MWSSFLHDKVGVAPKPFLRKCTAPTLDKYIFYELIIKK